MKNYYHTLGVSRSASATEIKKAYRSLARKYHPDKNKAAGAEDKFKEVQEAYDVLKDPEKKAMHEQFGDNWQQAQQARQQGVDPSGFGQNDAHGGFDMNDIFSSMFNRGGGQSGFHQQPRKQKGQNTTTEIQINLEQAYQGGNHTIQIAVPDPHNPHVHGTPKALKIKIPKGITAGQKIRLPKQGGAGSHGGANGDLYLQITFKSHALFTVEGANILLTLPLTPWEAALGTKITVPTLGGNVELNIPANSKSGQKLRLKNRGLPAKTVGDQLIVLQLVTPLASSAEDEQFYHDMATHFSFNPREHWS
ncbi:MAG: DnaJ domain-containing protein [Gammaproteobacteria bacterium]|nr:DnaJ domain-containing protein [Gammaproteobacteria bacterium]